MASRYGAKMQGCTYLALTKLDVLSYMEEIPVVTHYHIGDRIIDYFPSGMELMGSEPVVEYLPGFCSDISACRKPSELPKEALSYIRFIEERVGCPIKYVSVGAEREAIIEMF